MQEIRADGLLTGVERQSNVSDAEYLLIRQTMRP